MESLKNIIWRKVETPIGHIDFISKIVTATIFQAHADIIISNTKPYMFQCIPFQRHSKIN
jgi:hypothetical protein